MPLASAADSPRLRWYLTFAGRRLPVNPRVGPDLRFSATRDETGFYLRQKLSKPLVFTGDDFTLLYAVEGSSDRCMPWVLTCEQRHDADGLYYPVPYQGVFTCSEVQWRPLQCQAEVTPVTDDAYRLLLERWEVQYNLLQCPVRTRGTLAAQLQDLAPGLTFSFVRIGVGDDATVYTDGGYVEFLRNTSWITGFGHSVDIIFFRLEQHDVSYDDPHADTTLPTYIKPQWPRDLSAGGWILLGQDDVKRVAQYGKSPEIAGFRLFRITNFGNWTQAHVVNGALQVNNPDDGTDGVAHYNQLYGDKLLLAPCGTRTPDGYIRVTGHNAKGSNDPSGGPVERNGANSYGGTVECLNVNRHHNEDLPKEIFWKFGLFEFRQSIPLLAAIRYLLLQVAPELAPPTAGQLSDFFTNPVNYVTGETLTNELPYLVVAAASDVKRPDSSEAATRLLVNLKTVLTDVCAAYDCGWFVDETTGWLRLEHRAWLENHAKGQVAPAVLDTTTARDAARTAHLQQQYGYNNQLIPRYEYLRFSNAATGALRAGDADFQQALTTYAGGCVNQRVGENEATTTVQLLTGDLGGMLLSTDAVPDSALALLAPNASGRIDQANSRVSATSLASRYHTYGRARLTASQDGRPVVFASRKATRTQPPLRICLNDGQWSRLLRPEQRVRTGLGGDGEIWQASYDPFAGTVDLTLRCPPLDERTLSPSNLGRAFDDSFDLSFN